VEFKIKEYVGGNGKIVGATEVDIAPIISHGTGKIIVNVPKCSHPNTHIEAHFSVVEAGKEE
jgi:hypothetical protein